jgi:TonB-linked SusC/RagA family outer membrane protein
MLMKKFFFSLIVCLLALTQVYAQRTVSGKITDDVGEGLPGVNVVIKGTTTGTTTDIDGNYRLQVEDGSILVFSFVGFQTQEINTGTRSVIDVTMGGATELQEVVVTGYSSQDARSITGSVVSVGSEKFEKIPVPDVSQLLQGNVAGLQSFGSQGAPGSASQVRIRGIGSAAASSEPLYVVDGIPISSTDLDPNRGGSNSDSNPLVSLNPNDIESVVVLKDASSTAIYGSRGANGVIVITTKSGKPGETKFDVRAQQGWAQKAYDEFEVLNAEQYVMLRREAFLNGGLDEATATANAGTAENYTNWFDYVYRTGTIRSYDVSASGGDEKTRFYISGSYYNQEGHVIRTELDRMTGRINIDHSATDKLTIGFNSMLSWTKRNPVTNSSTFNNPVLQGMLLDPNVPVYNDDGTYFTNFNSILGGNNFNPVAIEELDSRYENLFRMLSKVYVSYDILPNLTFRTDFSTDYSQEDQLVFQNTTFGDGNAVTGRSSAYDQFLWIWQSTNNLSYTNSFGDHSISANAIFEVIERDWRDRASQITGFAGNSLPNPSNGSTLEGIQGNGSKSSLQSYLFIGRYNYKDKYFFDASFRRDGSSRFGADVRYGNFYSIGGAWSVIDEEFMSGVGLLSNLKLRVSFGETGNENLISPTNNGDFRSQGLFNAFATYNGNPGYAPAQIANPLLTWERKEKLNLGIDWGIMDSRISGTIDLYKETTSDLIFAVPVSRTTGFNTVTTNAASMENKGIELTLRTVNIDNGSLYWETTFNIAFNKNEVLKIGGDDSPVLAGTKNRTVGHNWSEYFLAPYAGVDPATGKPLWYDTLGNIVDRYDANNRVYTGKNAVPDYFGGLTNTLRYKGIDFSALIYFSVGQYTYNNWAFVYESNGGFMGENQSVTQLDRWQNPGDIARFPRRGNGSDPRAGAVDDADLFESSFLRLRNVQMGYTLPSNLSSKIGLRKLRAYVQGTNLLTFSPYKGLDPEQQVSGVEDFTNPPAKVYTVGIDIGF